MGAGSSTRSQTTELLRAVFAPAALEAPALDRLSAAVEHVTLRAGEWLFRAGEEASSAYVLASGRLQVLDEQPTERVIRVLRRGALIGELPLLRGGRRSASVRAQRDARLLRIDRHQFEAVLRSSPSFAPRLVRSLAEQLATNAQTPGRQDPPKTVAIVSLDGCPDAGDAAAALVEELRQHGTVASMACAPSIDRDRWPGCLARACARHDRVVLHSAAADPADSWTSFCLAEADLVVAVTQVGLSGAWVAHAPALMDCELIVRDRPAPAELIVAIRPTGVRTVTGRAGVKKAMSELGRRTAGRAVSVVLSGGGARAFAHIGVLEQLERAGIPIDRIGGVSMGAIVAALFARGDRIDEIHRACVRRFVERNPTRDYTLPIVSLLRGRAAARGLREEFAGARIESLRTPFVCTSTDLHRREQVVHRSGSLADALLASLAIPGVFPPVPHDGGRLLVDGGVLDNLPLRAVGPWGGPVIAVDVTGTAFARAAGARGRELRGPRALLRRWATGSSAQLPGLPELLGRCMTLASADTVAAATSLADLVIAPDVAGTGLFDWRALPAMRAAGAAAARRALADHAGIVARLRS